MHILVVCESARGLHLGAEYGRSSTNDLTRQLSECKVTGRMRLAEHQVVCVLVVLVVR
eukprot:COSAG02_NODE_55198_length_292_cov_0.373057_1_plen_57_part_01